MVYVCVQYLDSRGGDLQVVQASERALTVCEVGRRQLVQELQRHHRAVAVALRLFIQLLLVQENGQRLLPCGLSVTISISKPTFINKDRTNYLISFFVLIIINQAHCQKVSLAVEFICRCDFHISQHQFSFFFLSTTVK